MLGLVRSQVFTPRDFVIDAKGVCRLNCELARRAAARSCKKIVITVTHGRGCPVNKWPGSSRSPSDEPATSDSIWPGFALKNAATPALGLEMAMRLL